MISGFQDTYLKIPTSCLDTLDYWCLETPRQFKQLVRCNVCSSTNSEVLYEMRMAGGLAKP